MYGCKTLVIQLMCVQWALISGITVHVHSLITTYESGSPPDVRLLLFSFCVFSEHWSLGSLYTCIRWSRLMSRGPHRKLHIYPYLKYFPTSILDEESLFCRPPCMNGEMEGETEVFRTSLNQMCFAAHVWRPPCRNGLRGGRVMYNWSY